MGLGDSGGVGKLVHEVIHQVAAYRQMVQLVGTQQDSAQLRKEMHELQKACIKQADQTKLAMLPQLKQESHEGAQSTDFTRQAKQFSACLGSLLVEMKRAQRLYGTFGSNAPNGEPTAASALLHTQPAASTSSAQALNPEQVELEEDLRLTNAIMESLDELITSPFSTGPADENREHVVPKNRSKGCSNFDWVCKSFKTSYA